VYECVKDKELKLSPTWAGK